MRGKETAPDVLATAMAVGRKIGKVPVVVGVCHGFVGNRMLSPRQNQAERLLLEGALPRDVDAAAVEFGFPMGPFAMSDLAGIDVGWRIRKALGTRNEIADALADMGRFGQKTGRGFYIYEKGSRSPIPDPEVEEIIAAASKRLGIPRRQIDKKEIVERLDLPDDQRRREDSRRGHRVPRQRHRRDLGLRLWLADLARRADVLCRSRRLDVCARPARELR